ncbi:MAG: GTP 3',8-cyclase MoaA [Desulfobacteraceae bacterium]|nr:MAG: GTP 3',8-cyclase MoaA [Desulfobacteraceae bacterium]
MPESILPGSKLIDPFNRRLDYLRLSITDRCNLRCIYCQPEGLRRKLRHEEVLTYEEILRIARISLSLGIAKIRVTGGEPLVRRGVYGFLAELTDLEGLSDVSLTTNGVFLEEHIERIRKAGIRRLNISLDTLNREKYAKITGQDRFNQVWKGILAAEQMGFHPIKINIVALRGINEEEFSDFAGLTFKYPFHVRFIEFMPIGPNTDLNASALLTPEIKRRISVQGEIFPIAHESSDGPAERFRFEGAKGEIGFISALSRHFCGTCNRLRLTASGQLRVCLLSDIQFDLRKPLRSGASDRELADIFIEAVRVKPGRHLLACDRSFSGVSSQMSSIGG